MGYPHSYFAGENLQNEIPVFARIHYLANVPEPLLGKPLEAGHQPINALSAQGFSARDDRLNHSVLPVLKRYRRSPC